MTLLEAADPSLLPWLPLIVSAADADMESTPEVDQLADEFRRAKMHEAVVGFVRAIRTEPTLFVFEDAHVMDEASADLVVALTRDVREDRPWLILVLARPGNGGFQPKDAAIDIADLQPLGPQATRKLVETVTDEDPLPGHVIDQLVERSQGNPQLALDLVHTARSASATLPDSVEAAATVRIDALTPHDRQLVRRVSVFGMLFHPRFVNEVVDDGSAPDDAAWERLAEFFEPADSGFLRFRRAVIRDAAYAGLPFRTRRRLHLNVGLRWEREVADPDENGGLLSLHLSLGGEYDKAWRYARIAGERAAAIYANVEAARLYERAIDAGKRVRGRPGGTARDVRKPRLGADPIRPIRGREALVRRRAPSRRRSGDPRQDDASPRVYGGVRGQLPACARMAHASEPHPCRCRRDPGACGRGGDPLPPRGDLVQRVGPILGSGGLDPGGDPAGRGDRRRRRLGQRAQRPREHLAWLGRPGADDEFRDALSIYERRGFLPGQAMVYLNLGASAYWEGRWTEAAELYQRALELHTRTANPIEAAFAAMNIAEVYLEQGKLSEAEALLRDASRSSGHRESSRGSPGRSTTSVGWRRGRDGSPRPRSSCGSRASHTKTRA